jgi:hypothetical protein
MATSRSQKEMLVQQNTTPDAPKISKYFVVQQNATRCTRKQQEIGFQQNATRKYKLGSSKC